MDQDDQIAKGAPATFSWQKEIKRQILKGLIIGGQMFKKSPFTLSNSILIPKILC